MRATVNDSFKVDRSILRWGGLAGMLGAVLFLLVFVIVGVFVGAESIDPAGPVMRFPEIRTARTVENGLYLVVLVLWASHYVALYRALRGSSLAPALFGSVLGILGLAVLATGALPHAASVPISDLYHAPGATLEAQATVVVVWQAVQGIFDALLIVGLVILPFGLLSLGLAMLGNPRFGKGFGGVSVALGAIGAVTALVLLVDPVSPIAVLGVMSLIVFHLVLGWRVFRLSKGRVVISTPRGDPANA